MNKQIISANVDAKLRRQIEAHPYPLVFATISGAHLYGFPSPDSDFDLRGIHCLPLDNLLGLESSDETVEKSGVYEGLEVDLVTHDVRKFFKLLLKKNGYVLEQLLSPLVVQTSPWHEELKNLVPRLLTRHHAYHYLGFARTQWQLLLKKPRVKPLLYVLRVLLTGIHLMKTGEVEANLVTLNQTYQLPYVAELVELKTTGPEKGLLPEDRLEFFQAEYQRLIHQLEESQKETHLPDSGTATEQVNDILLQIRRSSLTS